MHTEIYEARKEIILEFMKDSHYHPMKLKEMCSILGVPRRERDELKLVLDQLISERKIDIDIKGRYKIADPELLKGIFSGNTKGFGFVHVEGIEGDFYVSEENTLDALHGDEVAIKKISEEGDGRRSEAIIVKVLNRANETMVGIFLKSKNYGFVVPDNQKIAKDVFVDKNHTMGAVNGHKVVVRLTSFGKKNKNPEGEIIEILGHVNDPGVDILSIVRAYHLPEQFPEEVMEQVAAIPEQVLPEEYDGRKDIRNWQTVTIDGEEAKDLDDAITIRKKSDGHYILGVHIADVSHYVKEGSPLDKEALKRGTSVYLTDRVIPMLPHKLSNGICSLNAGVDRLALSCIMELDEKGNILNHEIAKTVINVDRRMTYTAVKQILEDKNEAVMREYQELVPMFETMAEAAEKLREKRRARGGIDFDFPESKIILDKRGRAVDVKPYDRNSATKIIEDFMLAANETIAEDFYWQEMPFLYRTHETPDMERIRKLTVFLKNFGYYLKIKSGEVHPKEFQKLLGKIEDTPEEAMISRLVLRSMMRAKYTTENTGHFGLAVKFYTHFTSPIRRYPDLQIHRIIKEQIDGRLNERRLEHYRKLLPTVATDTSTTERRDDEAEREVDKLKKIEYMSRHLGEIHEGVISGITNWGMYVELPNTCEGMIRLQDLDDYYIFDENKYELQGEMSRQTFRLGQKLKICIANADKVTRTVDFLLADDVQ